jgi:hypothetical protein
MGTIDVNREMMKFHDDKVTLSSDEREEMHQRRNNGRTRLKTGLDKDGHARPDFTASQGSYMMRTMTQDSKLDYDIDDGAYFKADDLKDANGTPLTPKGARERVCHALEHDERLKHSAEVKENCVRQRYPEGYHIDIPVYRCMKSKDAAGNEETTYEHASGNEWQKSDARAVTKWFNGKVGELKRDEQDHNQLRRVVRLTKKFARRQDDWKAKTTSGIVMTKLVVDNFVPEEGREEESLHETWKKIQKQLRNSTQVVHPVIVGKNLADDGDNEVVFFRDCLDDALDELVVTEEASATRTQTREAWDTVFNTSFFSNQPSPDSSSKSEKAQAPFVVVSQEGTQRDDGGKKFG